MQFCPAFAPATLPLAASHNAQSNISNKFVLRNSSSSFTPGAKLRPAFCNTVFRKSPKQLISRPCKSGVNMLLEQSPKVSELVSEARRAELAHIVKTGPVFKAADMFVDTEASTSDDVSGASLDDWIELGHLLEKALKQEANDVRVYQYYLPIYFWVVRELKIHQQRIKEQGGSPRPFILGFCCPQGGGKTTMTTFIDMLLSKAGFSCQIASIDDFYVTNAEQREIASKYPDNRLLQYRGMPGTHDLPLMNQTLDALRKGNEVSIPRYDKTAFGGRGDRAPKEQWKHLGGGHVDVVMLEGWCLGFEPVPVDTLYEEDLLVVNDALCQFVSVYTRMDGFFVIEIENMDWVFEWRLQAERATRAAGKPGLSDDQVKDFVSRFMPAYKQYSKPLYNRDAPLCPKHELHIAIDSERKPILRKDL